jgi:NAD(P)-dependent dehydrogenase (short-subunit alcohol dehydrogenase family)
VRLAGTVAAVTGGSSGIGLAIARALAAEGAAVVSFGRRFTGASATPPAPGSIAEVHLDVTDEAAVRARFAELASPGAGLEVLVCSHGDGSFAPVVTASAADLRTLVDAHIVGTFLCNREALRVMRERRRGHIVNVTSTVVQQTFAECAAYTAAKAGQHGLTRVVAEEARPYGVRVTSFQPGATDTPIWDDRPGFDRSKMMRPDAVAALLVELICRPELSVGELMVMPPGGAL